MKRFIQSIVFICISYCGFCSGSGDIHSSADFPSLYNQEWIRHPSFVEPAAGSSSFVYSVGAWEENAGGVGTLRIVSLDEDGKWSSLAYPGDTGSLGRIVKVTLGFTGGVPDRSGYSGDNSGLMENYCLISFSSAEGTSIGVFSLESLRVNRINRFEELVKQTIPLSGLRSGSDWRVVSRNGSMYLLWVSRISGGSSSARLQILNEGDLDDGNLFDPDRETVLVSSPNRIEVPRLLFPGKGNASGTRRNAASVHPGECCFVWREITPSDKAEYCLQVLDNRFRPIGDKLASGSQWGGFQSKGNSSSQTMFYEGYEDSRWKSLTAVWTGETVILASQYIAVQQTYLTAPEAGVEMHLFNISTGFSQAVPLTAALPRTGFSGFRFVQGKTIVDEENDKLDKSIIYADGCEQGTAGVDHFSGILLFQKHSTLNNPGSDIFALPVTVESGEIQFTAAENISRTSRYCTSPVGVIDESENLFRYYWLEREPSTGHFRLFGVTGHTSKWGERFPVPVRGNWLETVSVFILSLLLSVPVAVYLGGVAGFPLILIILLLFRIISQHFPDIYRRYWFLLFFVFMIWTAVLFGINPVSYAPPIGLGMTISGLLLGFTGAGCGYLLSRKQHAGRIPPFARIAALFLLFSLCFSLLPALDLILEHFRYYGVRELVLPVP